MRQFIDSMDNMVVLPLLKLRAVFSYCLSCCSRYNKEQRTHCLEMMFLLLIASMVGGGCATVSSIPDRCHVSQSLVERTGHVLLDQPPLAANGFQTALFPDFIKNIEQLTETEAVAIALWNSPAYSELLVDLGLSRADVLQARELQNPDFSILFPVGPKQLEYMINVPVDSIFLRSSRIQMAETRAKETGNRLVQDGLDFVRNVRWTHSDLLLAQEQFGIAQNRIEICSKMYELACSQFRAGSSSELEVMTTEIELEKAKESLIRSKYGQEIASQQLRTLLGLQFSTTQIAAVPEKLPQTLPCSLPELLHEALQSRPDVWAATYSIQLAQQRRKLANWDFIRLTGSVSGKQNGTQVGPAMGMTLPLFNTNQSSKSRADAEIEKAELHLAALKQQIAAGVNQSLLRWQQAEENWRKWHETILPKSRTVVQISENAYQTGGDYLLLMLHNSQQLLDAQLGAALAVAEIRKACAEMEWSVGTRVFGDDEYFVK